MAASVLGAQLLALPDRISGLWQRLCYKQSLLPCQTVPRDNGCIRATSRASLLYRAGALGLLLQLRSSIASLICEPDPASNQASKNNTNQNGANRRE
uniref:Uncharacterized protein n=1 Tax=Ixodes ricinus TaxID=34613 RepID=A0A6B0UEZ9_IXORI